MMGIANPENATASALLVGGMVLDTLSSLAETLCQTDLI